MLKGILFVAVGAASYGMLATFVKKAYGEGYVMAEVTTSQFAFGLLGLLFISIFSKKQPGTATLSTSDKFKLMLAGTSMGLTSLFYYNAVHYIPVSIAIVLLMQTVWMGVVLEALLDRKRPETSKILAMLVVLIGTALAARLLEASRFLDWRGLLWGMLAAASFTTTMFTANKVAVDASSSWRSFFMLMGGAVVVFGFAIVGLDKPFDLSIFMKWGIVLALFGTIIPPILLNKGFPLTGIGIGSIVSSLELPVSVVMAYVVLHESVSTLQWIGILLIILAVVLMNRKAIRHS